MPFRLLWRNLGLKDVSSTKRATSACTFVLGDSTSTSSWRQPFSVWQSAKNHRKAGIFIDTPSVRPVETNETQLIRVFVVYGVHINWCVGQLSWANWRLAPSLPTSPWRPTAKLPNRTGAKLGICLGENVPLVTSLTANASPKNRPFQKDSLPTFIFQGCLEKAMLVSGRGSLALLKSYRFVPCKEFPFFMRYFVTSIRTCLVFPGPKLGQNHLQAPHPPCALLWLPCPAAEPQRPVPRVPFFAGGVTAPRCCVGFQGWLR